MSKLAIVSATQMSKILRHLGFLFFRQKGSHAYFRHPDGRAVVVPFHRGEDLGRGLIRAILREIDLSPEEFEKLRREV
jgi:predicted RNA binding protein YcfA (HicA-like mRNA interferase family)